MAEAGKNWGFCSDECQYVQHSFSYSPKYTGLALISYLDEEKCEKLLKVIFSEFPRKRYFYISYSTHYSK